MRPEAVRLGYYIFLYFHSTVYFARCNFDMAKLPDRELLENVTRLDWDAVYSLAI